MASLTDEQRLRAHEALNSFIHEYLVKARFVQSAESLRANVILRDTPPHSRTLPLGFLYAWWSSFWEALLAVDEGVDPIHAVSEMIKDENITACLPAFFTKSNNKQMQSGNDKSQKHPYHYQQLPPPQQLQRQNNMNGAAKPKHEKQPSQSGKHKYPHDIPQQHRDVSRSTSSTSTKDLVDPHVVLEFLKSKGIDRERFGTFSQEYQDELLNEAMEEALRLQGYVSPQKNTKHSNVAETPIEERKIHTPSTLRTPFRHTKSSSAVQSANTSNSNSYHSHHITDSKGKLTRSATVSNATPLLLSTNDNKNGSTTPTTTKNTTNGGNSASSTTASLDMAMGGNSHHNNQHNSLLSPVKDQSPAGAAAAAAAAHMFAQRPSCNISRSYSSTSSSSTSATPHAQTHQMLSSPVSLKKNPNSNGNSNNSNNVNSYNVDTATKSKATKNIAPVNSTKINGKRVLSASCPAGGAPPKRTAGIGIGGVPAMYTDSPVSIVPEETPNTNASRDIFSNNDKINSNSDDDHTSNKNSNVSSTGISEGLLSQSTGSLPQEISTGADIATTEALAAAMHEGITLDPDMESILATFQHINDGNHNNSTPSYLSVHSHHQLHHHTHQNPHQQAQGLGINLMPNTNDVTPPVHPIVPCGLSAPMDESTMATFFDHLL